jgi:hypothetical protein
VVCKLALLIARIKRGQGFGDSLQFGFVRRRSVAVDPVEVQPPSLRREEPPESRQQVPCAARRVSARGRHPGVRGDCRVDDTGARQWATAAGRDRTAAIMHDMEDYHITPAQAAQIANDAQAKLLVFYHLLPSSDGMLARRVSAQGLADVRRGDWTIADDGSLYTLPLGSADVRSGRVVE